VIVAGLVGALAAGVVRLYTWTSRRVALRERASYSPDGPRPERFAVFGWRLPTLSLVAAPRAVGHCRAIGIPRCGGAGPLVWRQLLGARRHWGSLLTAMIAPAILTCTPLFVIADRNIAFLSTTATLAFYTFLLLPTALRFDFHRDFDRLAILKGLPITPAAAVIGQTLAPVLIAAGFQAAVLALAVVVRSLPLSYLATAVVVMLPLNMLVFALDNFIYLLYPHRLHQEGLEIFVRTMLTFTAKGLLFAVGLAAVAGWGFAAAALVRTIAAWTAVSLNAYAVFAAGLVVGPAVLALLVLFGLCRTYEQLDAAEDVPH
jgi:hypothetical protein